MFLGIPDPSVWIAFLLMFLTTGAAAVYGVVMWNKGDNIDSEEETKKKKWIKDEISLEEEVDGGGHEFILSCCNYCTLPGGCRLYGSYRIS